MNINEFLKKTSIPIGIAPAKVERTLLIYFLLSEIGEILYIGKTSISSFRGRMKAHHKEKEFYQVAYFLTGLSEEETLTIESGLIGAIKPPYNKVDIFTHPANIDFAMDYISRFQLIPPQNRIQKLRSKIIDTFNHIVYDGPTSEEAAGTLALMAFLVITMLTIILTTQ